MNLCMINDALSSEQIKKYENLGKLSPNNFYFRLASRLIKYLSTAKNLLDGGVTVPMNILNNDILFKYDSSGRATITVNGVSVPTEKPTKSVKWLEQVVTSLVNMEQELKININRPGGRTLSDDRDDCRIQLNKYVSISPRKGESDEKYNRRMTRLQSQSDHDEALKGTFFTKFYKESIKGVSSALKKNASKQKIYSVERFNAAKKINPNFNEDNFKKFSNNFVSFYYRKDIPVVDVTEAKYSYADETRPITENEATGYTNEWARIPELAKFSADLDRIGMGFTVYKDKITFFTNSYSKAIDL